MFIWFKNIKILFVPTFEENGLFMLGVVFLFSQFSLIEITFYTKITFYNNKNFLYPIEDIELLSSNVKRYCTSDYFLLSSRGFKIAKLAMFWTKLCALWRIYSCCWERNANYLCVATYHAQQNRSKVNWGLIGRINFVRLKILHWFCPKFTGFQYFLSPKTIRYELRDSQNIQGFALIHEQSC